MIGYKHLTQGEYDRIKKMTEAGLSSSQVRAITGRSLATASYIRQSASFGDYYAIIHSHKPKTTPKKGVVSERKEDLGKRNETVDSPSIALLTRIAIALEKMEQHWQPTEEKKRFKII